MNDKIIFDIGMHTGQDTKHYLSMGYKVIAVEANPQLADANRLKFKKAVDSGQLIIENVGISDKQGVLPFYINSCVSEWSSFDKSLGNRRVLESGGQEQVVNIRCITIKDLIAKHGLPFFIKVDIEGYDYFVINDLPENEVPYVSCEFTEVQLIDTLKEKGYTKFKLISQADNFRQINLKREANKFFPIYLKYKNGLMLRLQKFITVKFPYSSSGPFGEDTCGSWMSYESAREAYVKFAAGNNGQALNNADWFDLHATR